MFDYWRERRKLRREIVELVKAGEDEAADREGRPSALAGPLVMYGFIEYERLIKKAHRLGIDYKSNSDGRDGYEIDEDGRLTGAGYARLRKAIRDERLNIAERYVKIFVPLLTALTGLIGVIVALVSVSRR